MTEWIFSGSLRNALTSSQIKPGDRVLLKSGTYTEGDLEIVLHGTAENPIVILPYPAATVTLQPASGYRALHFNSAEYITFGPGLVVDGVNVTNEGIKIDGGSIGITIKAEVKSAGRHGVLVSGAATDITIDTCHIHDNGSGGLDHGVYIADADNVTVTGCEVDNNSGHGVHANGGGDGNNYSITKNYVHGNGEVGIGVYHGLAQIYNNVVRSNYMNVRARYSLVSAVIAFNTITDATDFNLSAEELAHPGASVQLLNNVCLNGVTGIQIVPGSGSGTILCRNNLTYGNTALNRSDGGFTVTVSNNIEQAFTPLTDDNGANIKPTAGNPAIGAGVAVDGVTVDYGNNVRSNPPTIGAWE